MERRLIWPVFENTVLPNGTVEATDYAKQAYMHLWKRLHRKTFY
jgi:hypothetical protein